MFEKLVYEMVPVNMVCSRADASEGGGGSGKGGKDGTFVGRVTVGNGGVIGGITCVKGKPRDKRRDKQKDNPRDKW